MHDERSRPGSLARLIASGAIDLHALAAAEEIRLAHARTVADVAVRTARWERAGGGVRRGGAAEEGAAAAMLDLAYTRWRADAGANAAMLLAIVVDDLPLTTAARRWRMSDRRARRVLVTALGRWRRV